MKKLILIAAVCTSTLCNTVFANNRVQNGGFESPAINGSFSHLNSISSWTISGAKGELQKPGHTGKQHLELASNKGYRIQQNVSVIAGEKYIFSFYAKHRKAQHAKLLYGVRGGGKCVGAGSYSVTTKAGWTKYSHCICPTSRSVTIWFEQKEPTSGGYGIHLDDVRIAN